MTAQMVAGSSIKIETLETTWKTIVDGIEETRQIQENAKKQRIEDRARLENIKTESFAKAYLLRLLGQLKNHDDCYHQRKNKH